MKILCSFSIVLLLASNIAGQTIREGMLQLENEQFADAQKTFEAIASREPKNGNIYYYIGEVQYRLEKPDQALVAYQRGLSIDPQCILCNVGIGKLYLDRGNIPEADKFLLAAAKSAKSDAVVHGAIGEAYLVSMKSDATKAITHLTHARDLDPTNAAYWVHLGDAYRAMGDMGNAMTHYETSVEKDKTNLATYRSMARIWLSSKQYDLAVSQLKTALEINPEYAPALKDLYEIYITQGKLNEVVPVLERYVVLVGDDIDSRVRLVKFLAFQAKDYQKAITEGEELLQTHPEQYTLHRWLAWSYSESNNPQQAFDHSVALFDAALKDTARRVFPSDYDHYAKAAFDLGKLDDAAHIYRKYLELDPSKTMEIHGKLAKAYFDAKNYPQAIAYYRRKNTSQQLNTTDLYYLGLAYYYTDANTSADSAFAAIVEKSPSYAQGWMMRAKIATRVDSANTLYLAKPFYEKYIEFASADPEKNKKNLIEAYNYLGICYVQNEDHEKARTLFQSAVALDPANETAVNALNILNKQ